MRKNNYYNNIRTLLLGSGISHLIPILCAPILTRLYSPDNFGQFGLYLSLIGLFSLISSGCYHLAIVLPEKDEDADTLKTISLLFSIIFCIFLYIIIYFSSQFSFLSVIYSSLGQLIYILPLSVLSFSLFEI